MPHPTTSAFLAIITVLLLLPGTYAFGAGDIPSFSFYEGKAFRHGDIENVLEELAKLSGNLATGGGLLSFAKQVINQSTSGGKFTKGDVKKVYFGNWLRDYSQAMDIAGLSKLSADTLVLIVGILGFMTFGFATREFEVSADRLGVYLPIEHIDNPKGYAEKEGDARRFHAKLRPPVQEEELEIDIQTGMKKYMASEGESWDTSTAHIRRTLRACIEYGRQYRGQDNEDLWEAYRLLGTALHTLEDLLAHSNWCELALRKMGYEQVFCHVGDEVVIETPNGEAPPLVTGSFGSADFMHSMMGEATDHISQSSVTDLSQKINNAKNSDSESLISNLRGLLSQLPIGNGDNKMNEAEQLKSESEAYRFNPDNVAPPEVQQKLLQLLRWRDDLMRDILEKIEMVPGLSDLVDSITDALNAYVFSILAPWVAPILTQVTEVLGEGSKAVIDTADQFEVFNDPRASDPSHSLLSKDHFSLILNEPAGLVAKQVVRYTVNNIVQAWEEEREDPDRVIDTILEAFHHPYYNEGRSQIQHVMFETMQRWLNDLSDEERESNLQNLTKEYVRQGKNKRTQGSNETAAPTSQQQYGGSYSQHSPQDNYNQQPSYDDGNASYRQRDEDRSRSGYERQEPRGTGRQDLHRESYVRRQEESYRDSYNGDRNETNESHFEDGSYDSRHQDTSYGYQREENNHSSPYREESHSSHRNEDSRGSGQDNDVYGFRRGNSYGESTQSYDRSRVDSYDSDRRYEEDQPREDRYNDEPYAGQETDRNEEYADRRDHHSDGSPQSSYQPSYAEPSTEEYGYKNGTSYGSENDEYGVESGSHNTSRYGEGVRREVYGDSEETFGAERLNLNDRGANYGRRGGDEYESGY